MVILWVNKSSAKMTSVALSLAPNEATAAALSDCPDKKNISLDGQLVGHSSHVSKVVGTLMLHVADRHISSENFRGRQPHIGGDEPKQHRRTDPHTAPADTQPATDTAATTHTHSTDTYTGGNTGYAAQI